MKRRADSIQNKNYDNNLIEEELTLAEISEKMKNILFCSLSHELRSPLNHIKGILGKIIRCFHP